MSSSVNVMINDFTSVVASFSDDGVSPMESALRTGFTIKCFIAYTNLYNALWRIDEKITCFITCMAESSNDGASTADSSLRSAFATKCFITFVNNKDSTNVSAASSVARHHKDESVSDALRDSRSIFPQSGPPAVPINGIFGKGAITAQSPATTSIFGVSSSSASSTGIFGAQPSMPPADFTTMLRTKLVKTETKEPVKTHSASKKSKKKATNKKVENSTSAFDSHPRTPPGFTEDDVISKENRDNSWTTVGRNKNYVPASPTVADEVDVPTTSSIQRPGVQRPIPCSHDFNLLLQEKLTDVAAEEKASSSSEDHGPAWSAVGRPKNLPPIPSLVEEENFVSDNDDKSAGSDVFAPKHFEVTQLPRSHYGSALVSPDLIDKEICELIDDEKTPCVSFVTRETDVDTIKEYIKNNFPISEYKCSFSPDKNYENQTYIKIFYSGLESVSDMVRRIDDNLKDRAYFDIRTTNSVESFEERMASVIGGKNPRYTYTVFTFDDDRISSFRFRKTFSVPTPVEVLEDIQSYNGTGKPVAYYSKVPIDVFKSFNGFLHGHKIIKVGISNNPDFCNMVVFPK
jgi:hypothetical protein